MMVWAWVVTVEKVRGGQIPDMFLKVEPTGYGDGLNKECERRKRHRE